MIRWFSSFDMDLRNPADKGLPVHLSFNIG